VNGLKKVLIVDDSPAESKLMTAYLQDAGYWPVSIQDPTRLEQTIGLEMPLSFMSRQIYAGQDILITRGCGLRGQVVAPPESILQMFKLRGNDFRQGGSQTAQEQGTCLLVFKKLIQ